MELQEAKERFDRAGIGIVALTTDSVAKNRRISERLAITFPVLTDPGGAVLKKLDMWDPRWRIAAYGFLLLDPALRVIKKRRGHWRASPKVTAWFLEQFAAAPRETS